MKLDFSKINGTNPHLNYDLLEKSISEKLLPTCEEAEVIILNRFPVSVSSIINIDLIILLNIPKGNNSYYRIKDSADGWMYVKNQIIAVSIVNEYKDSQILIEDNTLEIQGEFYDYKESVQKLKWGLTNYLSEKCSMKREFITIHPLIWVKNEITNTNCPNIFVGNELTYDGIERVIKRNYYYKYAGYKDWYNSGLLFEQHVEFIFEQASQDSKEGYVTKKKIDRIQRKFGVKQNEANALIGNVLVEVKGKAGTGKTAELLKWMLQNSIQNRRGILLTYNHLLVYDITFQIRSFENRLSDTQKKASTTSNTIHSYFFNVAKKLGILLLMTEERIKELSGILDARWEIIESFLNRERANDNKSLAKLKFLIQNEKSIDVGTKREVILFLKHMREEKFLPTQSITAECFKKFRDDKVKKISNLESSQIFLKDYVEVLKRIYQATSNLDSFLNDYDIVNKYTLLEFALDLSPEILNDDNGKINFKKLKTRYKKSINAFRAGRILYVDEAQDCHKLERDILFNLFGSENCVIANGGKEQLIRFSELCNWHISKEANFEYHVYNKKNKSFRMKPAIAALANHIAKFYDINLNIEPLDTEDHGQIFISTSKDENRHVEYVDKLLNIGERQGCTAYESLILLKPASKFDRSNKINKSGTIDKSGTINESVKINEFNNIVADSSTVRDEWTLVEMAQNNITKAFFWNSTGSVDKRKLAVPGALSVRSIYYASCRGLEAWSVMCFGLDTFFEEKKSEDDADNYLLNDLFDQLTSDSRREMYAATWVLMAVTRCMENCYIQLTNPKSSLYQCLREFAVQNKEYVKVIK